MHIWYKTQTSNIKFLKLKAPETNKYRKVCHLTFSGHIAEGQISVLCTKFEPFLSHWLSNELQIGHKLEELVERQREHSKTTLIRWTPKMLRKMTIKCRFSSIKVRKFHINQESSRLTGREGPVRPIFRPDEGKVVSRPPNSQQRKRALLMWAPPIFLRRLHPCKLSKTNFLSMYFLNVPKKRIRRISLEYLRVDHSAMVGGNLMRFAALLYTWQLQLDLKHSLSKKIYTYLPTYIH